MIVRPNEPLPLPSDHFIAAMADGTVHWLNRENIADDVLRQLINANDQQPPDGWDQ